MHNDGYETAHLETPPCCKFRIVFLALKFSELFWLVAIFLAFRVWKFLLPSLPSALLSPPSLPSALPSALSLPKALLFLPKALPFLVVSFPVAALCFVHFEVAMVSLRGIVIRHSWSRLGRILGDFGTLFGVRKGVFVLENVIFRENSHFRC